jgi:hypothetical protein
MKTVKLIESRRVPAAKATSKATQIFAWENDPFAQAVPTSPPTLATPIARPVPKLGGTGPLPVNIVINQSAPAAKQYHTGTLEFRYWTAAEALCRGAAFWSSLVSGIKWHSSVGKQLPAHLDAGEDFNAYYDRKSLEFFHGTAGGTTYYSGESPDVACHELGHAVLDAMRPQLWNAGFSEVAAFHESFGDMSAMLSALQLPSMRQDVLSETRGQLSRSSSLSRLAEQLGYAIRLIQPSAVDADCLRNAANTFFYRDPSTLPPNGPAPTLCSEAHSFSRVFTGAFLDSLAGMLGVAANGGVATPDQLEEVSLNAAKYLIAAIRKAAVVPNYYSQVAAAMVDASGPADRNAVAGAFAKHGILSVSSASNAIGGTALVAGMAATPGAGANGRTAAPDLEEIGIEGAEFGLGSEPLMICAKPDAPQYQVAGATLGMAGPASPSGSQAAKQFLEDLIQLGRIDISEVSSGVSTFTFATAHTERRKTHRIVREGKVLRLRRLRVDCGFDCDCSCA